MLLYLYSVEPIKESFGWLIKNVSFRTRDHETALIQQAKEYTQRVAVQQAQLEKADRFGEGGDTSEVAQLRHDLLAVCLAFATS